MQLGQIKTKIKTTIVKPVPAHELLADLPNRTNQNTSFPKQLSTMITDDGFKLRTYYPQRMKECHFTYKWTIKDQKYQLGLKETPESKNLIIVQGNNKFLKRYCLKTDQIFLVFGVEKGTVYMAMMFDVNGAQWTTLVLVSDLPQHEAFLPIFKNGNWNIDKM